MIKNGRLELKCRHTGMPALGTAEPLTGGRSLVTPLGKFQTPESCHSRASADGPTLQFKRKHAANTC